MLILNYSSNQILNIILPAIPLAASAQISDERVAALLDAGIYNFDPANARDLESICSAEAMKCLPEYSINPTFLDPAYNIAIKGIREKINQLQFSVGQQLDVAIKNNLKFDVSKTSEGIQCIELQEIIVRLREEIKAQKRAAKDAQTSLTDKGKGKEPAETADLAPSPISEDEIPTTAPLMTKRKRSSPSRARTHSIPTSPAIPIPFSSKSSTIPLPQNTTTPSAPSSDEDDTLPIKKLKIKHSTQSSLQPSLPSSTPILTSTPEIMNLDDSDEE